MSGAVACTSWCQASVGQSRLVLVLVRFLQQALVFTVQPQATLVPDTSQEHAQAIQLLKTICLPKRLVHPHAVRLPTLAHSRARTMNRPEAPRLVIATLPLDMLVAVLGLARALRALPRARLVHQQAVNPQNMLFNVRVLCQRLFIKQRLMETCTKWLAYSNVFFVRKNPA